MLDWTRRHTLKLPTRVWRCFFLSFFFFFRQLNAFQVFRACWGHRWQPQWWAACLHLFVQMQYQRQDSIKTYSLIIYIKKKKKGFYNCNSVYVCVLIIMKTGSMKLRILLSAFRQKHNQPPHLCSSVDFIMIVVVIFPFVHKCSESVLVKCSYLTEHVGMWSMSPFQREATWWLFWRCTQEKKNLFNVLAE